MDSMDRSDSINDMQFQFITQLAHFLGIVKQAPGKRVGVFLTRAIVNLREGVPPQNGRSSVSEALSAGVDQEPNPQSRVQGPWGHGGQKHPQVPPRNLC